MKSLQNFLSDRLRKVNEDGLLRTLTTRDGWVDFSSNDYLGLARSRDLFTTIQQKMDALQDRFNGATGSRLLSGNSKHYEMTERMLARVFRGAAALIFNSGYAANQAVFSSIPQKDDVIFYDELAHACIKDGARLSFATKYPFRHNDLEDLERKLKKNRGKKKFIAVESIYSMDGDECPLQDLTKLAQMYDANVVLDEAHSTGVVGEEGSGLAVHLGLADQVAIRIHTFGKALGVHGACVVGSVDLTKYLINFARPFIYTTALPPHSIISIECAFLYLATHQELQNQLRSNIDLFLRHASFLNRTVSQSAIQTAIVPGNERVKAVANSLQQKGFDVSPIRSPTVPKNSERLRICLHSFNTDDEIRNLTLELGKHC